MLLTITDSGADYLTRSEGNRERLSITHLLFGSSHGYKVEAYQLALKGATTNRRLIDSLTLNGDILTVKTFLDENDAFDYGEVALLTSDSILIAIGTFKTQQQKIRGQSTELTFTVQHPLLEEALTRRSAKSFNLATTRTDFDDAVTQLQAVASTKDNFGILVTNETGNTLIELLAGVVDHNSYMAESAFQETLPHTAKLDSSIYAIQMMLKNRMTRNKPASASVRLTRAANLPLDQIPALSRFVVDGVVLFNREAIIWKRGESQKEVTLYQGEVFTHRFKGTNKDYQFWKSSHDSFTVSDTDVKVFVGTEEIPVVHNGLWEYKGKPAAQDYTYSDGALVLTFGNAVYGTTPHTSDDVSISYAVTLGADGNRSGFKDKEGSLSNAKYETKALALTDLLGGGNAPSASSYANFGGDLFGAQYGAVTPSQYRALARTYPGVNDAIVLAQRDLAPMDKDWFNVGKIILLTEGTWTEEHIKEFEAWFRKRTWYGMRWIITTGLNGTEPKQRAVDVSARIFCKQTADLPTIQRAAETAVRDLFTPRYGILARPVYRTDIIDALRAIHPNYIDYLILDTPVDDISMYLDAPVLSKVEVIPGGTLPIGTYRWAVSSVDDEGESRITYIDVTVNQPNSSVRLTWAKSKTATSYRIYGRSTGQTNFMGRLHETTQLTWADDGTATGNNIKPPPTNTSGVHYGVPGQINITVDYSDRSALEDNGYGIS